MAICPFRLPQIALCEQEVNPAEKPESRDDAFVATRCLRALTLESRVGTQRIRWCPYLRCEQLPCVRRAHQQELLESSSVVAYFQARMCNKLPKSPTSTFPCQAVEVGHA